MKKGCLIFAAIVLLVPVALGLSFYLAGPKMLERQIETPPLTPAQISQAEDKLNLSSMGPQGTLKFTATDLNALLQKGLSESSTFKQGKVSLKDGSVAVEVSVLLPNNSADFPALLRNYAGKEIGVYIELTPSTHEKDIYIEVSKASLGKIPLPVNTLLSLLPEDALADLQYTEHGINLSELVGDEVTITDLKVTGSELQIGYKTK